MSPAAILPTTEAKVASKTGYASKKDALDMARAQFVERNVRSLKLHEEAVKSLPGGNTRSLLHTTPFPVFIKSGSGHLVVDEDDHT